MTQFIVAEVSKNWSMPDAAHEPGVPVAPLRSQGFIQRQFELVIEVNRGRGYQLHSWQLHRLMVTPEQMNETIIAVFERVEVEGSKG